MFEKKKLWLTNVFAYVINALFVGGSTLGLFGMTNDEVSEENPTFVTPIEWAFTIWAVIFLFELIFVIWGGLPGNRNSRVLQEGVGYWFAIACVTQAIWSILFAQELLVVSAIALVLIAFSLFMAVVSLSEIQQGEGVTFCTLPYWAVYFPIGVHGGWTLAASLVNINVALELDDVGSELAGLILTAVAASVAALFGSLIFNNQPYLVAISWAILGVVEKQDYRRMRLGDDDIADGVNSALETLRTVVLCAGLAGVIYRFRKARRGPAHRPEEITHPSPSATRGEGRSGRVSALVSA